MKKEIFDALKTSIGFKPNRFWTGADYSKLVDEKQLTESIKETIDELDIHEGDYGVHGVYLFGSILRLHGKESHWRDQDDIDIYFWQKNPHTKKDRNYNMEWRIGNVLQTKFHCYGLPLDVSSFPMHPFENQRAGFIIQRVHPLYENQILV